MSELLEPDVSSTDTAPKNRGTGDGVHLIERQFAAIIFSCSSKATIELYDDEAATDAAAPVTAVSPVLVVRVPTNGSYSVPLNGRKMRFPRGLFYKITQGSDVFCSFMRS